MILKRINRILFQYTKVPYTDIPAPKFIPTPKRPALDVDDPNEKYVIPVQPRSAQYLQDSHSNKHLQPKPHSNYFSIERKGQVYHFFDASRISFGELCQQTAKFLMGKHKPIYEPTQAIYGDKVIIVNASKIKLTKKKAIQKEVIYHTGFVGHLRRIPYKWFILNKPEQLIFWGAWKNLPSNKLRRKYLENLEVFKEKEHPYYKEFPQFIPPSVFERFQVDMYEEVMKSDSVVFSNADKTGTAIDNMKRDENSEEFKQLITPFKMRDYKISFPGNKKFKKDINKWSKMMRRYKSYKIKPAKVRNPLEEGAVIADKTWQLKKWGLEHRDPLEDDEEIEDEVLK